MSLTYPRIRGINNETIGSKQTSAASATAKALLILLFSLISIVQIVHLRLINRFQTFQSFLSDTKEHFSTKVIQVWCQKTQPWFVSEQLTLKTIS